MHRILILITLFTMSYPLISEAKNYYRFLYTTPEKEPFSAVLKKFVKDDSIINAKTPLVQKTFKGNPQVKDWRLLEKDTTIELYVSDDFLDMSKYQNYADQTSKALAQEEQNLNPAYPVGLKGSLFYMSSIGNFTQTADNVAEIDFKQNSPVSLGTSFSYYPKDKLYSTAFSLYYSYLLTSASTLSQESVDVPTEIGGNLYGEFRWEKFNVTLYAGPDYESFSVFNLRGLQNDKKIYVDGITAMYMTFGLAKSFSVFGQQFFSKISISKSLQTTYKNNAPPSLIDASEFVDNGKYSGQRYLFYLNYKINNKFYLHTLLKYHSMTGPSKLTTTRIGAGIGYILF